MGLSVKQYGYTLVASARATMVLLGDCPLSAVHRIVDVMEGFDLH